MNKVQAVEHLVKDQFEFLLSKSFTQQKLRQYLGERYGNNYRRLETADILVPLVTYMKVSGVPAESIRKYIDTLPIFRGLNKKTERQLLQITDRSDYASGLKPEDKNIISKFGAFEAAKKLRAKEIEEHVSRELNEYNRKIQEAREEYERLPSILEEEVIPEPAFDPHFEETQQWWERFYLKANPFPFGADGLAKIDESLYEEILVKTKPFQDVLSILKKNSYHLFHTGFLLVGDYGYGKTTFIDYLSYYLIQNNILPIRITPSKSFPDSSGYEDDFHLKLRNELRDELFKISNETINDLSDIDTVGQIKSLVRRINNHRRDGIVVFLDDYHKRTSGFKQVYEFLGLQQILKNDLTRSNLNVGFIVSGTPEWRRQLSNDGQMRGFLDNTPIIMPNITPEMVCEVFNQRIRAYCFDESTRRIRPEFVQRLFKEIQGQAGLRDYLTEIISQLSNNNLSIIDTPVDIGESTLASIRSTLERDEELRSSFQKLTQTSKFQSYTKEQIAKCLGLLIQTSIHDGITEGDMLFVENKFYFQLLREANLIQKRKRAGSDSPNAFEWVISARLQQAVDEVREKFKFGINDYLLKLYAYKGYASQPLVVGGQTSEISEYKKFFSKEDLKIPQSALHNITLAMRLFEGSLLEDRDSVKPKTEQINRAWEAFSYLSDAFFEIDGSKKYFSDSGIVELKDRWQFHWFDDEILSELLHRYEDYGTRASNKNISGSLVWKQLKEIFPILADRLKAIVEDVSESKFEGLLSRNVLHTKDELRLFQQVREGYASAVNIDHYKYVKSVTDQLELKLRAFLYVTSVLVFGDSYEQRMPESLQKYSTRNLSSRVSSAPFSNAYSGITRSQLRVIFSQGNPVRNHICRYIDCGWNSEDWERFFEMFVVENITSAHQLSDRFTHLDRTLYLQYCRRSEELMCGINTLVRDILKKYSYLLLCDSEDKHPSNFFFKFNFKPSDQQREETRGKKVFTAADVPKFLLNSETTESTLGKESYAKVIKSLHYKIDGSPRYCLVEDLLEIEYIVNNYSVTYLEFIQSLIYAYYVEKRIVVQPWFGSSILIKRAASTQPPR